MARDAFILNIAPNGLRLCAPGARGRVERAWTDEHAFASTWAEGLSAFDAPLQAAVDRLGARGARTDVVYHGGAAVSDLLILDVAAANAVAAAGLAFAENFADDDGDWQQCLSRLASPPSGLAKPKTLILASAEHNANLELLAALLERAGLRPGRFLPARAVLLAGAARRAIETAASTQGEQVAIVVLSEWTTAIAVAGPGGLQTSRATDFGYAALGHAIRRTAERTRAASSPLPPAVSTENALKAGPEMLPERISSGLLFTHGIPPRGQNFGGDLAIQSDDLLVAMQPALQRFVIETRQTLRFSLDDAALARSRVLLGGPGASIPGLARAMESQLEIPVEQAADERTEDPAFADACDLASDSREVLVTGLGLMPRSARVRARTRRLMSIAVLGVVIAMSSFSFLVRRTSAENAALDRRFALLSGRLNMMEANESAAVQAAKLSNAVRGAQNLLRDALGERTAWGGVLADLSRLVDPATRLMEISGRSTAKDRNGAQLLLRGSTPTADARAIGGADPLTSLLTRLAESPLVGDVRVLSSREGVGDDIGRVAFEISVRLRSLPIVDPAREVEHLTALQAGALAEESP